MMRTLRPDYFQEIESLNVVDDKVLIPQHMSFLLATNLKSYFSVFMLIEHNIYELPKY